MSELTTLITQPWLAAAWAAFGVVVSKAFDFVMFNRKASTDAVAATYTAVNAGQKQLIDGLFQQVRILQEEVSALREQSKKCEEQHRAAGAQVEELRLQIAAIRKSQDLH
jgi:peptidoglycan hydrolase CwlO-like protein